MSGKLCPACTRDPDPRGPSACYMCRELKYVAACAGDHPVLGERALNRLLPAPDLSGAHVDRVARRLFRAFDDANQGHEPLHDFDVMAQCEYEDRPVIDNWRALAREAIRLGAVITVEEVA